MEVLLTSLTTIISTHHQFISIFCIFFHKQLMTIVKLLKECPVLKSYSYTSSSEKAPMYCKRQPCRHQVTHRKFKKRPVFGLLKGNTLNGSSWLGYENSSSTSLVHGPSAVSPISTMKPFTPLK